MAKAVFKVYVYNENCTMAGRAVPDRIIADHDGDPDYAGDWSAFEGTADELRAIADAWDTPTANQFRTRLVASLRDAVAGY